MTDFFRGGGNMQRTIAMVLALAFGAPAAAQTVRVGFLGVYSSAFAPLGEYIDKGAKLYMKNNADKLPPGVKIELVVRDAGGPNPDKAKQLVQEMVVRDKIQILTGLVFTPNALAIAPLATEAKLPTAIMNAGASVITTRSPYLARFSFTLWQSSYPLGQWAARKYKSAYILVSDFGAGHDSEAAFEKGFSDGGGQIVAKVRMPLQGPDFVPFMQRVKDTKPDILFAFIPAGKQATAIMKAYGELGLDKAGIKFIGPGDITIDEAIREQRGKIDPEKTMEIFKNYTNPNSPRGPIAIDPATRDIVQNEYIREVRRVGGQLVNVEIDTIPHVKDQGKELNKQK